MKVKSASEGPQLCPTLSNPMVCSALGSSVHGIFRARVLEWGATAFSHELQSKILETTLQGEKRDVYGKLENIAERN